MKFSNKVKEVLEARQMTGVELARLTGYSAAYISDLLSGSRRWNEDSINKVCEALEMKVNFEVSINERN